ncbi:MAG: division/cell wall cluster transcriptional repressor MraZ [Alphaproteobacteria bacterium]
MSESVRKRTLFLGTTLNKVDAKGRVSLPADFRSLLKDQNTVIVAYRSFASSCIEGCTAETMEKLAVEIENSHDFFSEEQDDLTNLTFGDAQEFNFDSTGRILLTEKLLKHAQISDKAVFVGKGRKFQIWNPEAWEREEALMREKALKNRPHIKKNLGE